MVELSGKRIVIAGGSGFLGLSMAEHFAKGNAAVTVLSRSKPKVLPRCSHHVWDGKSLDDWTATLDGADAVINLAGRTVNCIKTPNHQDEVSCHASGALFCELVSSSVEIAVPAVVHSELSA